MFFKENLVFFCFCLPGLRLLVPALLGTAEEDEDSAEEEEETIGIGAAMTGAGTWCFG